MAQTIYKFWQGRWKEAWYQLSEEEQHQRISQVQEAIAQVGGRSMLICSTYWSNEQWLACGVEEFPNMEAVQQYAQHLVELDWPRYIDSITTLGTEWRRSPTDA